jgi:hypothetical protein
MASNATRPRPTWKALVSKVLSAEAHGGYVVRPEWKKLGDQRKIELLQNLYSHHLEDIPKLLSDNQTKLVQFMTEDVTFLLYCLTACLESDHLVGAKFKVVFVYVEDNVGEAPWARIYDGLFVAAVDRDAPTLLAELLSMAHDGLEPTLPLKPQSNNVALRRACEKNSYALVKPLLDRGYRLEVTPPSVAGRWRDEMMEVVSISAGSANELEGSDHIKNLQLLELHVKSAYLLACYATLAEKYDWEDTRSGRCFCECDKFDVFDIRAKVPLDDSSHFCVTHRDFMPSLRCTKHIECNDPVSRCFIISKLCVDYSASHPDRRQGYDAVSKSCQSLAVQMLEQCASVDEVELLLREKASAARFFSHGKFLTYPRLRLAVELNHKYFAGHIYCQQVIRDKFYGGSSWSHKSVLYKLIYFTLQTILTPLHSIVYQSFFIARQIPSSNHWFPVYARKQKVNLDLPMNRFISYSGWHFVFVALMLQTTIPGIELSYTNLELNWKDYALMIFTGSMLLRDILTIISLKSIRLFAKFWRIYFLISHLLVTTGMVLRVLVIEFYKCCETCPAQTEDRVDFCKNLILTASTFHGFAAIMSLVGLLYWFQFHSTIGPIVINLSRVTLDIFTMV